MNPLQRISTPTAAPAGGHYSQGVVHGGVLYVSGQLPTLPDGTRCGHLPFDEQAALALENVLAIVAAAGGGPETVLKVTVYVVGAEHWPTFNAVYAARMGEARPARAVIPVPTLNHGALVEIDAIAAVPH
ncbi:MAG: RidA family protein [Planctomycetota bacterium]